ncbi:ankyrin repeat domain-containing protein 45 [Trichomycterus rosablanca]|uniref:ankyrin repeat domain-containing protein 45 n=1 Tax=Trichomycterus rosablanca TaxID=2290929 RepID=UPI002F35C219
MQAKQEQTLFSCALDGDLERIQCLIEEKNVSINTDSVELDDILWETDEVGRNAVFVASMLGRSSVVQELVTKKCAEVNASTTRGYSLLHCSAMWGHLDTVKALIELGADLHAISFRGETAVDVARRYSQSECVDHLAWADAKQSLEASIAQIRDIMADPEKGQEKLNKEDKNTCVKICSAKTTWIQKTKNPTTQEFIEQKKELEDVLAPILAKLATV